MKWILPTLVVGILLLIAYRTKPDDRTCIETAVKAVWGARMPQKSKTPELYGQFMVLNSNNVIINDWVFLKRIRYRFPTREYNIGIGAFNHIFMNN